MFLRYIKEINSQDAVRIRNSVETIQGLSKLMDSKVLSNDLQFYSNYTRENDMIYQKPPIILPLPVCNYFSEFEFKYNSLKASYSSNPFYQEGKALNIFCGKPNYTHGITFELMDLKNNLSNFAIGPFLYCKEGEYTYTNFGYILRIAYFFYNKRLLYEHIYKALNEHKNEFGINFGNDFTNDLFSLFSVNNISETIPDFDIPNENVIKRLFQNDIIEKRLLLISTSFYSREYGNAEHAIIPKGSKNFEIPPYTKVHIYLYLNVKNQLIINATTYSDDIYFKHHHCAEMEQFIEDKAFNEMLQNMLNGWLKDIVSVSNFGAEIYNKIKTKLFLNKI